MRLALGGRGQHEHVWERDRPPGHDKNQLCASGDLWIAVFLYVCGSGP